MYSPLNCDYISDIRLNSLLKLKWFAVVTKYSVVPLDADILANVSYLRCTQCRATLVSGLRTTLPSHREWCRSWVRLWLRKPDSPLLEATSLAAPPAGDIHSLFYFTNKAVPYSHLFINCILVFMALVCVWCVTWSPHWWEEQSRVSCFK
jgi:hypothetical protein